MPAINTREHTTEHIPKRKRKKLKTKYLHEDEVPATYTLNELPWGADNYQRHFAWRSDTGEYGWVQVENVYQKSERKCYNCKGSGRQHKAPYYIPQIPPGDDGKWQCQQCSGEGKQSGVHDVLMRSYERVHTYGDKKGQTYEAKSNVYALRWDRLESGDYDEEIYQRDRVRKIVLADRNDKTKGWVVYDGLDNELYPVTYEKATEVRDWLVESYEASGMAAEVQYGMKTLGGGGLSKRVERPKTYVTLDQVEPAKDYSGRPFWETWKVNWESCECGGDYSCSHGQYPYEMERIDGMRLGIEYGWGDIQPENGEMLALAYGPSLVAAYKTCQHSDGFDSSMFAMMAADIMKDYDKEHNAWGKWWRGKQ